MFCTSDRNTYQQICGKIGKCKEGCQNSEFSNGLKNY
jgi:hypothetical protein